MLKNPQHLQNVFKKDRAYTFLKNIRGSPPYWQKMFCELLAMIRTLGIPTWFPTLSTADMKWPEVIQSIAKQYGTIYTEQEVLELPWMLKSMWLRSNQVTPVQMFLPPCVLLSSKIDQLSHLESTTVSRATPLCVLCMS